MDHRITESNVTADLQRYDSGDPGPSTSNRELTSQGAGPNELLHTPSRHSLGGAARGRRGLVPSEPGALTPGGYRPGEPDGPFGNDAPQLRGAWRHLDGECVSTLFPPLGLKQI